MSNLFHHIINYLQDPFGKKSLITKHTNVLAELRTSSAQLRETNAIIMTKERGSNAFERAVLGNQKKD